MASCSQYSAAFGYQVYIVPVFACGVDLSSVTGGVGAAGFIDPTTVADPTSKVEEGATSSEILLRHQHRLRQQHRHRRDRLPSLWPDQRRTRDRHLF